MVSFAPIPAPAASVAGFWSPTHDCLPPLHPPLHCVQGRLCPPLGGHGAECVLFPVRLVALWGLGVTEEVTGWEALAACAVRVVERLDQTIGDEYYSRLVRGVTEVVMALAAVCEEEGIECPEPDWFCCCDTPEAKQAICVIHAALALERAAP
jgi:hypothetical protein